MATFLFQDGTTGCRHNEAEEGDSGLPPREQSLSLQGDSGNDWTWTNNNSVGIRTDCSGQCGEPH